MQALDLNLLGLIVGLSVYVSSIRFLVIGRLIGEPEPPPNKKTKYKRFLRWLIPADVLFVIAGVTLFLHLFWKNLFVAFPQFPQAPPAAFEPLIVWALMLGVLYLALHHVVSWWKSLRA